MHAEALTAAARGLFPRLASFAGFYLVGGTALALQIGHRLSVDFDLFTAAPLPKHLHRRVREVFGKPFVVTYRSPEQLNLIVEGVKLTLLEYEYPVLEPFVLYEGVPMLGLKELAATKAFAIGKRLSMKDYVDWYFLLEEERVSLPDVIALANKKYGGEFNDRLFLSQLASIRDVRPQKIDFLRDEVDHSRIESFLEDQVRKFPLGN